MRLLYALCLIFLFLIDLNAQQLTFFGARKLFVSENVCNINYTGCDWRLNVNINTHFLGYAHHPSGETWAIFNELYDQDGYNRILIYNFELSSCTYQFLYSIDLPLYWHCSGSANLDFAGRLYLKLLQWDATLNTFKHTISRIADPSQPVIETLLILPYDQRYWEIHFSNDRIYILETDKPFIRVYNSDYVLIDTIIMQKHITGLTSISIGCDSIITYASHMGFPTAEYVAGNPDTTLYLSLYDIESNVLTPVCNYWMGENAVPTLLTSPLEFLASDPECDLLIDLDRDNSTGVYPYDYLDEKQYCSSIKIPIADDDTYIHSSAPIDSIRLTLSGIQDAGMELLLMEPIPLGINFVQLTDSTYLITSSAPSDSLYTVALEAIYFFHTDPEPSPGARLIFVQGFNEIKDGIIVASKINIAPTITTNLYSTTCLSSEAGIFTSSYTNQSGCDSLVINTIEFIAADITKINQTTCYHSQTGIDSTIFSNQFGCDSIVITENILGILPDANIEVLSHQNGYDISCNGNNDGMAFANVIGVEPFIYIWSNGEIDQTIQNLGPGYYSLTVTDIHGCRDTTDINLIEPDQLSINLEINSPTCFGENDGFLKVIPEGGVNPILFSLNGSIGQTSQNFEGLASGTYSIAAIDANGCEVSEIIWINVPVAINVDLGSDQSVLLGDTTNIIALVNVPFDSISNISWTGLNDQSCDNCLSQIVAPIVTTTYTIMVANAQGCKDQDSLTVFIELRDNFFMPNIFSPNGDGLNDEIFIPKNPNLIQIKSFSIFDRWGNTVFQANNLHPGSPDLSWDGTHKGIELNPGVYVYHIVTQLKDGREVIRYGDITLIK